MTKATSVICVSSMLSNPLWTHATELELFTTRQWPVTGTVPAGTHVYVLDDHETIEAILSRGLPADPQAAVDHVRRALRVEWQSAGRDLTRAYEGLQTAKSYGIERVPALVIDGRTTIFAADDIGKVFIEFRSGQ